MPEKTELPFDTPFARELNGAMGCNVNPGEHVECGADLGEVLRVLRKHYGYLPGETQQSEDALWDRIVPPGTTLHTCGDNPPDNCEGILSHATMAELESVHVPVVRAAFSRGRHIGHRDTRDKYEKRLQVMDERLDEWRRRAIAAEGALRQVHRDDCECGGFDRTASHSAGEYVGYCAKRTEQASGDEKMPDVPDSTLTRGQARALTQKPEPGIEILTSAMLRPYESPLFDGPRQATEITFVCPADWDVTRFMRTLRGALDTHNPTRG